MQLNLTPSLKKALRQLEADKERINHQITAVRIALEPLAAISGTTRPPSTRARARRRRMSVAARKG